jgi:hypothetical protein
LPDRGYLGCQRGKSLAIVCSHHNKRKKIVDIVIEEDFLASDDAKAEDRLVGLAIAAAARGDDDIASGSPASRYGRTISPNSASRLRNNFGVSSDANAFFL